MDRILSRLRSRHSRATKQPFITQLHNAINDKSFTSTVNLTNGIGHLQVLFTKLENIPDIKAETGLTHDLIRDIVTEAYDLISPTDLSLLLRNLKIDPTLKTHLPNTLGKLSRYYSAASSLVCAARDKECRVFRTIVVQPFHIDVPPSLHKDHIKVHAEIQLLFFYELNDKLPRPRVICSSKSACYLCNLFFSLHGVFHIPRSHGRLYDKWTLPDWIQIPTAPRRAELGKLATRMDASLNVRIKKGCNKRDKHDYPTESVISISRSWPPSTTSKAPSSIASISTVRPRSPLRREGSLDGAFSQLSPMPPTPPTTPPALMPSVSEAQTGARADRVELPADILPRTMTTSQLPYSEVITAKTRPLYLHLDSPPLTLDFDFSHASPCRLLVTRGDDRDTEGGEYRIVEIEDIPTAEEMKVACIGPGPRDIKFQLQGVCVAVLWGGF